MAVHPVSILTCTGCANVVERAFNRLKQWRGIATRYDKTACNYRAGILLAASTQVWL